MKITILGSGTSTGVPMVGCSCPVCRSLEPWDKRTRASILIETAGNYILVDTSTDLRKQAIREKVPRIDAVLFTHSHADHINGIDDLRGFHFIHKRIVPCYGFRETLETIGRNFSYIFKGMESEGYASLLEPHIVSGPFRLFGKTFIPVPLLHGAGSATGYRVDAMAYLTDCSAIPPSSRKLLDGLDSMHNDFDFVLIPKRTVFTHLTHEVSCRDGDRLPAGVELAYDGMVLELD